MIQTSLVNFQDDFLNVSGKEISEWGTFKDSLKTPVHNWFTYPAGFSYKAVIYFLKKYGAQKGQTIYDPFMGSGTTNLVAKSLGFNSYGVEAHPFVFPITQAKMDWEIDVDEAKKHFLKIKNKFNASKEKGQKIELVEVPELLHKCYEVETLEDLIRLRDIVNSASKDKIEKNLFFVALVALLREVSLAATGWPYIAPKKIKSSSIGKIVINEYEKLVNRMLNDILTIRESSVSDYKKSKHEIFLGDCRDTTKIIEKNVADFIFTSPPYLNNFDYADRTRLEMYFFGEANTWADISSAVRERLMTSATTQINRSDDKYILNKDIKDTNKKLYANLQNIITQLAAIRQTKGGKKSYDLLVAGYFNDMHNQLRDSFRILKSEGVASYVLGDSAPYGVHVQTDVLLGEMAKAIGFSSYTIEELRARGGKWKDNPQRHSVPLRETIVTLRK